MIGKFSTSDFDFVFDKVNSITMHDQTGTIANEYYTGITKMIPALSKLPWQAVIAYYETFDGYVSKQTNPNEQKDKPKTIRVELAQLILVVCQKISGEENTNSTLFGWLKNEEHLNTNQKLKLMWDAVSLIKLVLRTYNLKKS
ncbi:MAG: hypothetical protein IPL31_17505 [Saprospiraceae bacterium]|nr:hypothetical protein [Saprospiraceae bacterium]